MILVELDVTVSRLSHDANVTSFDGRDTQTHDQGVFLGGGKRE